MKVAFKASSFKNSSYHIPRASYIQAKELRKDLKENTQGLAVTHQEERIRCPILSSPTRVKQICVSLLTPHLHSPLLLQLGGRFYLEGILLGKVQNQGPPLSSGIGSIKHLGREPTRQMNGDREMKSHQGGPKVRRCTRLLKGGRRGRRQVRLTAICPLSSVRYAFTSSSATRAHCLPREQRNQPEDWAGAKLGHSQRHEQQGCHRDHAPSCSVSPLIKNFP